MRYNLYRFSEIISFSFFVDYVLINSSGGNVIFPVCFHSEETFVMPQIQIRFLSVYRNITFTMFIRIQCPRVNIDIRIQFLDCHPETACLQQFAKRCGDNPFAQRRHHTACHEYVFSFFHFCGKDTHFDKNLFHSYIYLYPLSCTEPTARPDGSAFFLNASSHSSATGVLQATEGTDGTHCAAESEGNRSEYRVR